uniref:NADH dehydrogenase subunit 6 n=1 Tax=Stenophyella macreta TaxID=2813424 RepID=A0A8T9ZWD3_9HEMI|nr:NADH dehydrogenase subunit 6 [Stenophyella macreta]
MNILIALSLSLAFIFMWLKHPLSMTLIIILQTFTFAMITTYLSTTSWFSYIIVIIMLSGMLVLFMYMASVASNEKFYSSIKLGMTSIMILIYLSVILYLNKLEVFKEMSTISMETISLKLMFNKNNSLITMMMILYLFFAMVVVSYIVNIQEGPLRKKN